MRRYDAVILGGGLAGLTLARQLHLEAPELKLLLLERRRHPVPEAAFKVGESTVEIGAHYLHRVLDLEPHLRSGHLQKLGIRYFFPNGDNRDLTCRFEVGPTAFPDTPSFQIDRGRLENTLLAILREARVEAIDGCAVRDIELQPHDHVVHYDSGHGVRSVRARWLADASGRSGLIRRKLGLTRPVTHAANACWFRVKARVDVDEWSDDPAWQQRVPDRQRWLSTNHLMGRGYWVWLIPLGSGSTSLGIVADGELHPFSRISRYEHALQWLDEFEPQFAAVLRAYEDRLEDFLALKHYAYGCERVFSRDGWALVGEAGVFTDPFYSPGSDFIAIGNDCASDLITRAARGEDVSERAEAFNTNYLALYDAFLRLYDGQYPLMGNAQVMTAKASWDNACYWGVTGLLYFQRRYRRPEFMATIDQELRRFFVRHARMQQLFRAWDVVDFSRYGEGFANVVSVPALRQLQSDLSAPLMTDDDLRATLTRNLALLEAFARSWQAAAIRTDPSLVRFSREEEGELLDISHLLLQPLEVSPVRARLAELHGSDYQR
jgi:flavin-dependent dehydrogenase